MHAVVHDSTPAPGHRSRHPVAPAHLWTASRDSPGGMWTADRSRATARADRDRETRPRERGRPRSGDNRGRRRTVLRGGGAGPPSARPRRGANTFIVDHLSFNRNSAGPRNRRVAPPNRHPTGGYPTNDGYPPRTRRQLAGRAPAGGWHPADGVPSTVIRLGLPGVHSCSRRTGTSPSRSVHQWTARAWVPDGVTVVVGLRVRRLTPMCTPVGRQMEPLTFGAAGAVRVSQVEAPRPHRVADASVRPARPPATTAVRRQRSQPQSPAPRGSPVAYAASAPR